MTVPNGTKLRICFPADIRPIFRDGSTHSQIVLRRSFTVKQRSSRLTFGWSLALIAMCAAGAAVGQTSDPTARVALDATHKAGGPIPERFLGISIEWTLVERYMNPKARPAFTNLLRNLGSGFIRVGGGSQESTPYNADAPNTDSVITNADFAYLRATIDVLDAGTSSNSPPWGVVLGTAMNSNASPANTQRFVQGIATVFAGAEHTVAGIGLANEPDLGYRDFNKYLTDLKTYSDPAVSGKWPLVVPSTSNDIVSWTTLADKTAPSRWFWNWPQILDAMASTVKARAGVFGPWVSDHFYPLARTCGANQPWRCPSIPVLLSKEHIQTLDYQVYTHAALAAAYGVPYRLEETNTAARQGAPGVSDVAASATYALDMMFHVACPQPPNAPGGNAECTVGGIGVNLQNAARNGNTHPEQGNAYYNVLYFDSSEAMGPPSPAPEYYAALLFAHLAQGTSGLRPVTVSGQNAGSISAWRVEAGNGERRLFMINKSDAPVATNVSAAASRVLVHRMTPLDPTGAGRTLNAPAMQIDGQQVRADGTWPGFAPTSQAVNGGQTSFTLAPGEAVVVVDSPEVAQRPSR